MFGAPKRFIARLFQGMHIKNKIMSLAQESDRIGSAPYSVGLDKSHHVIEFLLIARTSPTKKVHVIRFFNCICRKTAGRIMENFLEH